MMTQGQEKEKKREKTGTKLVFSSELLVSDERCNLTITLAHHLDMASNEALFPFH